MLFDLIALDSTCHLNGPPEQQELLGKGGLSGIGVRDDGKTASLGDLVLVFHKSAAKVRGRRHLPNGRWQPFRAVCQKLVYRRPIDSTFAL